MYWTKSYFECIELIHQIGPVISISILCPNIDQHNSPSTQQNTHILRSPNHIVIIINPLHMTLCGGFAFYTYEWSNILKQQIVPYKCARVALSVCVCVCG